MGSRQAKALSLRRTAPRRILAIRAAMEEGQFGAAGARVVLEECLVGPEVSFFAICDGTRAMPLRSAQDHKRVFDDDRGPNTGGMGAFSPSPLMDEAIQATVMRGDRRACRSTAWPPRGRPIVAFSTPA